MGFLGILIGLAGLIFFAFRGSSILILAPIAALIAAALSGRTVARQLNADLHEHRGDLLCPVLSAVPAWRIVRQAHGRFRLGSLDRQLNDH